jgi:mono/diheme cytochrome c family protein
MRFVLLMALGVLSGCDEMTVQPKQLDYSPQVGPASVPVDMVEFDRGTVEAPGHAPPVTMALLQRGQERYRIYCTPCHSELGDGHGMIVQRGFPAPPSFHIERLRSAPPQYLYDVITNGRGVMYSFADRVAPQDRWAIVAYIRALQRSQNATAAQLPASAREWSP